jgi:hypothetical protein
MTLAMHASPVSLTPAKTFFADVRNASPVSLGVVDTGVVGCHWVSLTPVSLGVVDTGVVGCH